MADAARDTTILGEAPTSVGWRLGRLLFVAVIAVAALVAVIVNRTAGALSWRGVGRAVRSVALVLAGGVALALPSLLLALAFVDRPLTGEVWGEAAGEVWSILFAGALVPIWRVAPLGWGRRIGAAAAGGGAGMLLFFVGATLTWNAHRLGAVEIGTAFRADALIRWTGMALAFWVGRTVLRQGEGAARASAGGVAP